MPQPLDDQGILAFLMEAPRTGHVATVRKDGRPHVATIWFTVDGDEVVFVTSSASVKARNLSWKALASFTVDDPQPPFSFVALEGPVVVERDMAMVRHWARIIAARYISDDAAKAFTESDGFPDDMVCRLTPSHMTGIANLAEA